MCLHSPLAYPRLAVLFHADRRVRLNLPSPEIDHLRLADRFGNREVGHKRSSGKRQGRAGRIGGNAEVVFTSDGRSNRESLRALTRWGMLAREFSSLCLVFMRP